MWQAAECGIDVRPIHIRNLHQIHLQASQHGQFIPDFMERDHEDPNKASGILGHCSREQTGA